ncbi:putative ferric-chelate reductase 1 [Lissotriton helveticus]
MRDFVFVAVGMSSYLLVMIHCYPNGQVAEVCDSLLPNHGGSIPQTSQAPYTITVSSTIFSPGDQITVTLQANSGTTFKGFLLQAHTVGKSTTVGSFLVSDSSAQILQCNSVQNSAVSHTSATAKSKVSAVWVAPSGLSQILFSGTFVQSYSTFWTQVESRALLSKQISGDDCGLEKFCFSNSQGCNPANASCFFMSLAPSSGGGFTFQMSALSDGYVAVGFSDDKVMGNDDIYICVTNAGRIDIQRGSSTVQKTVDRTSLITVPGNMTSFESGVIKCSFSTENIITTPDGNSNGSYYIFLARGPSLNGIIQEHTQTPLITNDKVNTSEIISVVAQDSSSSVSTSVRAHGALMLIAWMTTGSIGMVFARYLRYSAKRPIFGKELWFQVHQALMVLTVAATITAFVVIFADVKGWVYDAGAHPVLGCIVMILSFFQPIIAFFRPDINDKRRIIFNYFHAANALIIKVLAVAELFLGLQLIDTTANLWQAKVLGGFVGWEALTIIILEVNFYLTRKGSSAYEIADKKVNKDYIVVNIYVVGNLAFLIALLVGIGQS